MTSRTTTRRQLQQAAAKREREQRVGQTASAADHFTDADRAVAENLEARELLAAFIAEEI